MINDVAAKSLGNFIQKMYSTFDNCSVKVEQIRPQDKYGPELRITVHIYTEDETEEIWEIIPAIEIIHATSVEDVFIHRSEKFIDRIKGVR